MTIFDWFVIGILAICTLQSLWRGLVSELLNLGGWIIAFIAARLCAELFADLVLSSIQPHAMAVVCGFIAVFLLTRFAIHFLRTFINTLIDNSILSGVNRLLGAGVGFIKGMLFITVAVIAASLTDLPRNSEWQHSVTLPLFEQFASLATPYLPEFLAEKIQHYPHSSPTHLNSE